MRHSCATSSNQRQPVQSDSGATNFAPLSGYVGSELRLLASQEAFEKVRKLPVIMQYTRNRGAFRRLESVYYDTPDQLLFRCGISLRVQRSGNRFIQTLELPPIAKLPLERRRWEVSVDGNGPDLARIPAGEIGDPVAALTEDTLVPVFTVKIRRRAQRIDLPDASVEIAFNEGTIEARMRREALSEIELKLKSGNAGAVFDLGEQLLSTARLQFGTRSQVERGYVLAFDVAQSATKAELPSITAGHVIDSVIELLIESCWHHLLKSHAVVQGGVDPEGLHQMRVALRRLRTICVMFRREIPSPAFLTVNLEAKWLMQQLGRAREWDVFVETAAELVAATPDVDLGGLREVVEQQRRSSYGAVQAILADPRCSRFLLALGRLVARRGWRNEIDSEALLVLSQPIPELADKMLARLRRKAVKHGAHFQHLDFAAQHNLRIDLKKLRYAAEFLSPLYADNAPAKRYIKRLARLQSSLGRACDIVRSSALLETIRQNDQPALHLAIGAVAGWQGRDQLVVAKTLRKRWRRFKAADTFWGR